MTKPQESKELTPLELLTRCAHVLSEARERMKTWGDSYLGTNEAMSAKRLSDLDEELNVDLKWLENEEQGVRDFLNAYVPV